MSACTSRAQHRVWTPADSERAMAGDALAVHVEIHGEPIGIERGYANYGLPSLALVRATRYFFACGVVVDMPDAPSIVRAARS